MQPITSPPTASEPDDFVLVQRTGNVVLVSLDSLMSVPTILTIESRTSDPASPAVGRIWLRTDL